MENIIEGLYLTTDEVTKLVNSAGNLRHSTEPPDQITLKQFKQLTEVAEELAGEAREIREIADAMFANATNYTRRT